MQSPWTLTATRWGFHGPDQCSTSQIRICRSGTGCSSGCAPYAVQLRPKPIGNKSDTGCCVCHATSSLRCDCMQVHAHGGALIELDGVFFWYGTSQKQEPGWLSTGINMYSSEDLATWQYEGEIFNWRSIFGMPAGPPYRIERPKVRFSLCLSYCQCNVMQGPRLALLHLMQPLPSGIFPSPV